MEITQRPLVALLTDFGTRDPWVAAMKIVLTSRCDAEVVDLGHEIAPHDVFEAALFLDFAIEPYRDGRKTIVVAVVDPGVGSDRRIVAAAKGSLVLLAPDNGLLDPAIDDSWELRAVEASHLFERGPSSTFHGRDRFAPVAAALASGAPFGSLGPALERAALVRLPYEPPRVGVREVHGTIIAIDRFGNAVTDVEVSLVGELRDWVARVGSAEIGVSARTYAEREGSREPFLIVGSRGTVEISLARGSAADLLHLDRLGPVHFHRVGADG